MNKLPLLILIITSTNIFSQPSAKEINRAFNDSYKDLKDRTVTIPWVMCNDDSLFFKSDTLRLFKNTSNCFRLSRCCSYAFWAFYENKRFHQEFNYLTCADTSQIKLGDRTAMTMKYISDDNYTNIETYLNDGLVNVFRVISLNEVKACYDNQPTLTLVLKRLR